MTMTLMLRGHVTSIISQCYVACELDTFLFKQTFENLLHCPLPYGKVLLINHKSITLSFYCIFFQA